MLTMPLLQSTRRSMQKQRELRYVNLIFVMWFWLFHFHLTSMHIQSVNTRSVEVIYTKASWGLERRSIRIGLRLEERKRGGIIQHVCSKFVVLYVQVHGLILQKQLKRARKTTKKIESKEDIEGFSSLSVDDKKMLLSLIDGNLIMSRHTLFNLISIIWTKGADPDTIRPSNSDASTPKKPAKTKKSKDWIIVRSRDEESIALQSSTPLILGRDSDHLRSADSRCGREQRMK